VTLAADLQLARACRLFAAVAADFRMTLDLPTDKGNAMNVIENGIEKTHATQGSDWSHSVTRDAGGVVVAVDAKIGGMSVSFVADDTYDLNPAKGWAWIHQHGYLSPDGERRLAEALQQCQPHGPRNARIIAARRSMLRGDVNPSGTADRVLVSMDGAADQWVTVADIRVAAAADGETAAIYRAILAEIDGHLAVMPRR
jgi:hypothetical protein